MARTWALLARISDGLNPLRETFEAHVKKSGLAAVEAVAAAAAAASTEAGAKNDAIVSLPSWYRKCVCSCGNRSNPSHFCSQDPSAYIQALLSVHKKNEDVVEKSFKGEKGFGEALGRVSTLTSCREPAAVLEPHNSFFNPTGLQRVL